MFPGKYRNNFFLKSLCLIITVTGIIIYIIDIESLGFTLLSFIKIKYFNQKGTEHPFVFLQTFGRLGNQMFEFACGYTLAKKNKIPLLLQLPQSVLEDPNYPNGILNVEDGTFGLHYFKIPYLDKEEYERLEAMTQDTSLIQILMDDDIMSGNYPVSCKILNLQFFIIYYF